MEYLVKAIKFVIISILSVLYWPLNTSFLWFQGHYRKWWSTDRFSFYIATPLYYLFFVIVVILSLPLEIMGEKAHPQLPRFR